MNYTRLGRSNMEVSRVCLGTMHFGSRATAEESLRVMDRAFEMGINFWDTANVYGGSGGRGRSEELIGQWFQKNPGKRDQVVLATKVYGQMVNQPGPNQSRGFSAYKVLREVQDSLKRLQTERIDLYQVHHFDRSVSVEEFWGTLETIVQRGDARYIGTSNFPGWGLAKFQMAAWQRGFTGIISEQSMYNLLCRAPELEVLPAALEMGIGLIPYMPLAGGLLTGKMAAPQGSRTADVEKEYGIPLGADNLQFMDFSTLCQELGEKESVVAIAWTLAQPAVASPIVGIRTVEQLDGLDRAAELVLSQETLQRLDEIFSINKGRPLKSGPAPEAYSW